MGFHICISNENCIDISIQNQVYGNVGKLNESRSLVWGKIKDLYAVKPGDLIVFYVKNPVSEFKGVYEVTSKPYICSDNMFCDEEQFYPYRFNFKQILNFPNQVPSYEFYSLVESGKINSLISLSRDVNSSYRGIRQLFESEFNEFLQLFYKYNPKTDPKVNLNNKVKTTQLIEKEAKDFNFKSIHLMKKPVSILFNKIPANGKKAILEDVLHAYIIYNVLHDLNEVKNNLGLTNFNELILEAPIFKSMQYRSDILATYKTDNKTYYYSFFELKRDKKIKIADISQLVGYLKSFASSKSLPINSYEGVYIAPRFDDALIEYLSNRIKVEGENLISLITYEVDNLGSVSFEKIV